jgi:hypothetical protein
MLRASTQRASRTPLLAVAWLSASLIGLTSAGCGGPTTSISGTVTLGGQPLEKAIVQFRPERENDRPAVVLTDASGRYRVAVTPVPFRVVILCQRVAGQRKDELDPEGPLVDFFEDLVPEQYMQWQTTPLRVEPEAGHTTVADFSLPRRG